MYNPVEVCWFDWQMTGAPAITTNTPGGLITGLDACLVNGFNSQTLTSVVVSGGVATATKASHGFWDHTVVQISGATPADLNGKKRITLVNANSFTFEAVGIANGTATGTIVAKMAPAGWTKTSLGTNDAYYTKPSTAGTPWALRVDDTANSYSALYGRKPDGTLFSGNGSYNTIYFVKGTTSTPTSRQWSIYADGRSVYIFNEYSGTTNYRAAGLVDLASMVSNQNDCVLFGCYSSGGNSVALGGIDGATATTYGHSLAPGVAAYRMSMRLLSQTASGNGNFLIDGIEAGDGCFHCAPMEIFESSYNNPRGILGGCFSSLHDHNASNHGVIINNPNWIRFPGLRDHKMRILIPLSTYQVAVDITGPWYPHDRYVGGYRIRGTAKKQGAVGRFPLALMLKDSGQIIRKTLSAADGSFAFNNIDYLYQGYTVVEYDGEVTDPLNAAIADLITPEPMP